MAIWGYKLDSESLFAAVKLIVMMTNSHELVIESCYTYCFALTKLINGQKPTDAFILTKEETDRRAKITGLSTIKYWIENDIEASEEDEEMPIPHYRPISYIKTALLWCLFYLRKNVSYEEAVKDIISRGGDTRSNAALVGGLIGAAYGIGDTKQEILGFKVISNNLKEIVKNAPKILKVNWSGESLSGADEIKVHFNNQLTSNW